MYILMQKERVSFFEIITSINRNKYTIIFLCYTLLYRIIIMGGGLILIVMLIYAWVAIIEFMKGNYGMTIVFAGYAFSNIGLAWMASKG